MSIDDELSIVAVSMSHWERLCELFATSRGVDACWCAWPSSVAGTHRPDHARNRSQMQERLRAGESPGLLALEGGRPVGWCALGRRDAYPQYEGEEDTSVWAIPCLYVDPTADRGAVGRALIAAAMTRAQQAAAAAIEGPPPWWLPGDDEAIALATATFVENGFERVAPGARMPVLRRRLLPAGGANGR